ncbi:hypothetical protein BVY04_00605 [bacterium M21]|nr:hypothetical protein BVY04_00605 [bacterium M21]
MKKIFSSGWTKAGASCIVAVLIFLPCHAGNAATEQQAGKSEVKILQARCLELQAALLRSETELEAARANQAEALVELKKHRKYVEQLRLKAANVLVERDRVSEAEALRQLLVDLQALTITHESALQELKQTRRYLAALFELLGEQAGSALKASLEAKLFLVEQRLQEATRLGRIQGRTATPKAPTVCRVLDVNAALAVIVLDIGRTAGALLSSQWLVRNGSNEAILQIVEVRPTLSAALVIKGKIEHIFAGSDATRWQMKEAKTRN